MLEKMPTYYFDVLPVHPRPKYLESLTSYLTRLAEENGFNTFSALSATLFEGRGRLASDRIKECPLSKWEIFSRVTRCPENLLLTTTVYYLVKKFGRPIDSSFAFVSGCLAPFLRYCPYCLNNCLYYVLPWRFLILKSCHLHSCQLLDICGHCGRSIPILTTFFKIATCPFCKSDLRKCKPLLLGEEDLQKQENVFKDLVFLLSPSPWDDLGHVFPIMIGSKLELLRRTMKLALRDLKGRLGIGIDTLLAMEHGYKNIHVSLRSYFSYLQYLGITFFEVFNTIQISDYTNHNELKYKIDENKNLLSLIKNSIIYLQENNQRVTYNAISSYLQRCHPDCCVTRTASKR